MSFGFSIGDIILCTQIAHRLFSSVTDGRKNAPGELKELEDALFGLYCALDHLQHEHEAIVLNATSKPGNSAVQDLGLMINSCRTTLEQLDNATAKYREAADDSQHAPPSTHGRGRFRSLVKVQLMRVAWDLRSDSLTKYRQKLQAHADSINLLLITSIWSSTNRIEENGAVYKQRLDDILQQASQFNNNVFQLVQCLLASSAIPSTIQQHHHHHHDCYNNTTMGSLSATMLQMHGSRDAPSMVPANNRGFAPSTSSRPTEPSLSPGPSTLHHSALTTIPLRLDQAENVAVPQPPPPAPSAWPNGQFLRLPESIHTINEERKVVGDKEFEVRRLQLYVESSASIQQPHKRRNLPASMGVDSVQQLGRLVEHIFQTLNVPAASRITTNHDLQTDIVAWVSKLGNVIGQLQASTSVFDKQELNMIVSELAQVLVRLNLLLEESEVRNRGVFYDASGSRIDMVFTKLRGLSTVCEKEIEEFEDEREDWCNGQAASTAAAPSSF